MYRVKAEMKRVAHCVRFFQYSDFFNVQRVYFTHKSQSNK
jgi:hypothetical protein